MSSTLEYGLVTGAPGPVFNAAVAAQIALGFAPLGAPYVSGANLEQVMIKGAATTIVQDFAITAVVSGAAPGRSFTVAGNQTKYFNVGFRFTVVGSTGNNGVYTVVSTAFAVSTVITVKESVPSAVADGTIILYSAS